MVWQLLAVARFVGAALLGPGSALTFAAVCVASGATLGADMVILPAMFSVALTQAGLSASQAFGLWSFAGKLGLFSGRLPHPTRAANLWLHPRRAKYRRGLAHAHRGL